MISSNLIEALDRTTLPNCGNCLGFKTKFDGERLKGVCILNLLSGRNNGFNIDRYFTGLPVNWQTAQRCDSFYDMREDI